MEYLTSNPATLSFQPQYCQATHNYPSYTFISNVTLGSLSNNSSYANGYQDFSSINVSAASGAGLSYSITSTTDAQAYTIWLDANNDGDFSAGEMLANISNDFGDYTVSGALSLPTLANGSYRLRIRGQLYYYGLPADPCSTLDYGETEDYSILIGPPPCPATISAANLTVGTQQNNSTQLTWTPGNGTNQVVILKAGSGCRPQHTPGWISVLRKCSLRVWRTGRWRLCGVQWQCQYRAGKQSGRQHLLLCYRGRSILIPA